jgi:hypothetical protein
VDSYLPKDFSLAVDVIPQHKPIQIVSAGEKNSALGLLGHPMSKSDVLLGLRPTWYQEQIDGDPLTPTLDRFSHRLLLGPRVRRIQ